MGRGECATVLIDRCVVLASYHHRRGDQAGGKAEMREELGWLAEDALRWDVKPEVVAAGVLAELRRLHDAATAEALVEELWAGFGLAPMPA